jgi:hypothetical protein
VTLFVTFIEAMHGSQGSLGGVSLALAITLTLRGSAATLKAGGGRGASRSTPARPRPPWDQAALTSITFRVVTCGAGILTSSMPFAYFASTWATSTPSGSSKVRWNAPYASSRTK